MNETRASWPRRVLKGFAMFWWDFLIGDTPELFVAVLVTIGVVVLVRSVLQWNAAAAVVLPALAISALAVSVRRAQGAARKK